MSIPYTLVVGACVPHTNINYMDFLFFFFHKKFYLLKSLTSNKRCLEHLFISGSNPYFTSQFCEFVLSQTTISIVIK